MTVEARRFPRACVCSPHHLASAVGLEVLASGGNAMDAAVATNLALGVVQPYLCGYGGDLFALVWDGRELAAYNGSGRSAAAADLDTVRGLAGGDRLPAVGPLTVTVPGAVEGWFVLLERFGTRSFAELSRRALEWALHGFVLSRRGGEIVSFSQRVFTDDWAGPWREVYEDAAPGRRLRQPALARLIETLAAEGPDAYYRGPVAEAMADAVPLLTPDDLAAHHGDWIQPMRTAFRGLEIVELPPNTQGVTALEALAIADGLDLGPPDTAAREHLLVEVAKAALADREHLTDPGHMRIDPGALLDPDHVAGRRDGIDPERAGDPRPVGRSTGDTIYLCAADGDGRLVSLIQSNYLGFGSGVHVSDWGLNLQNRGSFFSLDAGHPNVIAPSKRTLHTLIPALAFEGGSPRLVFGTMGGDGQAQTHLQLLVRMAVDGADPQQAISAPRWVVDPGTWTVAAEDRFDAALLDGLAARGHTLQRRGPYDVGMGHAHAILVSEDGDLVAGTDPRTEGAALGL